MSEQEVNEQKGVAPLEELTVEVDDSSDNAGRIRRALRAHRRKSKLPSGMSTRRRKVSAKRRKSNDVKVRTRSVSDKVKSLSVDPSDQVKARPHYRSRPCNSCG